MKKLRITVLLVLTMMFSVTPIVCAEDKSASNEEKIEYLKSIGTTEEAIDDFNPQQIEKIYDSLSNKEAIFSGYKSEIIEITDGDTTARGNIPTSKLRLSVATYDLVNNDGKITGVDVSMGYEWLSEPVLQMKDGFMFTWDNNTFYDNGFYAIANCDSESGRHVCDSTSAPATAQAGGMGWYLKIAPDIPSYIGGRRYYGGAQMLLRPRNTIYSGSKPTSKMYFTYAHQLVGVGISFGSSGSVGVSITDGKYDQQTLSYTY